MQAKKTREFSSVGLEHLLDMQEVAGSNPVAPTSRPPAEGNSIGGVVVWMQNLRILGWRAQ